MQLKFKKSVLLFITFFTCSILQLTQVLAQDWHFKLGISHVTGLSNIVDQWEKNKKYEGYMVLDSFESPIGFVFEPYFEVNKNIEIGLGIGPFALALGDMEYWDIPLNFDLKGKLITDTAVTPFIIAGLRYHITDGDYVEGSSMGFLFGGGLEFKVNEATTMGLEIAYDTSEIEYIKYSGYDYYYGGYKRSVENIKPTELMITLFALF